MLTRLMCMGVSAAMVFGVGCKSDPKVMVTPFVLKPCTPRSSANVTPTGSLRPATRKYEEEARGGVNSFSAASRHDEDMGAD